MKTSNIETLLDQYEEQYPVVVESIRDEAQLMKMAGWSPQTIYEAFADFLEIDVANGDATEDTVKAYWREVRFFVIWLGEMGVKPEFATRRHIEAYREYLKAQGMIVSTRAHKLSIIRRFYEAALKHGFVSENPAARVRGGKDLTPPEEKIKALSLGALGALLQAIPNQTIIDKRDRAIVALMSIHGLRRVEVYRLDHSHLEQLADEPKMHVCGKGNKWRSIYLREDTLSVVQEYVQAKMASGYDLVGALFCAHGNATRGQRISRRALNMIVDNYLTATSLKTAGVSCHSLRHTHGTLAVAGGAKLEHLKEAMGHSSIETTGIYVRAVARSKNNPASFIDVKV